MTLFHSLAPDGTHIFQNSRTKNYLYLSGNNGLQVSDNLPSVYSKLNIGSAPSAISCIIGIIKLKINKYVIIADKHTVTGSVLGKEIAHVDSFKILPLSNDSVSKKDSEESSYLDLLHQHLSNATLFYSIDNAYDLTNSLQRQFTSKPVTYDHRFWWNSYLCEELVEATATDFVTPIIYGYFKSHAAEFKGHQSLEFALVTRRSINRAGTRYFRRGIDDDGNVGNYNETEQILTTHDSQLYSFIQTRGSVPVYWSEINNLKYRPNLVVSTKSSAEASQKHFAEQIEKYGENFCVNLVNQKGYELAVKEAYENAVDTLPPNLAEHVKYIYFDFHHECRNMRWDRISLLLERLIQLGYTSDNYFHFDLKSNSILSTQDKVVRTNCMDCLDRTNVVQSTLGRWVLQNQFIKSKYLQTTDAAPWEILDPSFNLFFMSFWADNADAVSFAYSGTGALKTDFTRLGKRTRGGAVADLINSITRYYRNNLKDGTRQDSFDLFLGNYRPFRDSLTSPFIDRRPPYIQLLPYLMCTSLLVLFAILWYPRGSITDWKNVLVVGACIFYNVKSLAYLNKNGYQFVNWPKLNKLDFIKKVDVFDGEGKFTGIRYEEQDNFKTVGKKRT